MLKKTVAAKLFLPVAFLSVFLLSTPGPIFSHAALDETVVLAAPTAAAAEPAKPADGARMAPLFAATALLSALVFLCFGTIYFTLSRRIGRALKELTATARHAAGNPSTRFRTSPHNETGRAGAYLNTILDTAAAIRAENAYYQTIINRMNNLVIVTDSDSRIKTANRTAAQLLGYTPDELAGMTANQIFDDAKNLPLKAWMECPADQTTGTAIEKLLIAKNGQKIPVLLSGTAVRTPDGTFEGIVFTAQDMTQHNIAKNTLSWKLLQADKMAAVGQLAGGVAHEINNPLAIILGFAQSLLKRITAEDPAYAALQSIERETRRCQKLVSGLLTFSRADKSDREKCTVNEVIDTTVTLVQAQARFKSVDLVTELAENIPEIVISRSQIQQVILNLCNNALDALPQNGRLTIRTRFTGTQVEIDVQDNGSGIPPAIQAQIFEPFFTTKDAGKGTGLGLSLVHDIIERHQGAITFDSAAGKGTTFTIHLPAN